MANHLAFSVVLFLAIAFTRPVLSDGASTEVDVIILGAGISGITAGNHLQANGLTNFLILEAQDYIGGRIKQARIGNVTVGEGANWVHLVEEGDDNPILGLAKKINLNRYANNYTDMNLRNSPHSIEDFEKALKTFEEIIAKVVKENEDSPLKQDESLSSSLAQRGWLPDTNLKRSVEWIHLDFEYALKTSLISSRHFTGISVDNDMVTDPRGFKGIIDDLARNITKKIKTEKIVTQIKYNSPAGEIEVRTKDGDTYKAGYALCTFSTAVLASDLVKFIPELPSWKKAAISRVPLVYYTNIYAKFPSDFWDENEFIHNAGSLTETFPMVYNLNKKGMHPGSNVLLFTAVEDNSLRIEAQSENETKAEVMETLRKMYPNVTIPEPTEFFVGQFSQNPYVRGGYGNAGVGSSPADFHNLQGRLGNLFFSGEATDEKYWGYCQGGYLTGLKQAKQILKCSNGLECPEYHPEENDMCPVSPADRAKSSFVVTPFVLLWLMLLSDMIA